MANPSDNYKFMILLSPAKSFYSGEVKVLIAEHFSRANGGILVLQAAETMQLNFTQQT
jgi:branched-chain amino acid aminotransferase